VTVDVPSLGGYISIPPEQKPRTFLERNLRDLVRFFYYKLLNPVSPNKGKKRTKVIINIYRKTHTSAQDPITQEWTLEGGALVLADRGENTFMV
jgi:hypothetical protein